MLCAFCPKVAVLGPRRELNVCSACANAIGALAQSATDTVSRIWHTDATRPEPAVENHPPTTPDAAFERFKEGVARQISPGDAHSHLNLAAAYAEMGLLLDARREAGMAVRATHPEVALEALTLLLAPPLLRGDGGAHLRAYRAQRSANAELTLECRHRRRMRRAARADGSADAGRVCSHRGLAFGDGHGHGGCAHEERRPSSPPASGLTRHRGPVRRSDRRLCALPRRANRVDQRVGAIRPRASHRRRFPREALGLSKIRLVGQRHRRGPFRSERGCRLRPAGRERSRHVDGRVHRAPTAQSENRALLRQISERAPILHDRLTRARASSRRRARERDELAARDDALRDLSRATHLNPALVEPRDVQEAPSRAHFSSRTLAGPLARSRIAEFKMTKSSAHAHSASMLN